MSIQNESQFIEQILRESGEFVLSKFGSEIASERKEEQSQIVTDVDIASEKLLIEEITSNYPNSSIVAEESGFVQKDVDDVWIIDPIDGTSNFANGLPWFGVMVAHMVYGEIVSSGIYLPVSDELFLAQKGEGAYKNGKKFQVSQQEDLTRVLVSFGTDGSEISLSLEKKARLYQTLLARVLNIRTTNSAVDYVYAAEGKIGGLINLENKIWDIAPVILLAAEAGCIVTDIAAMPIILHIDKDIATKNFTLLFASQNIHAKLTALVKEEL